MPLWRRDHMFGLCADEPPASPNVLHLHATSPQASGNAPYSLDALLALLRLYQFTPAPAKPTLTAKAILLASMRLPAPDLKACLHLISDRQQRDGLVTSALEMGQHLEAANYAAFWATAAAARELVDSVIGFTDACRAYIQHTLALTYRRVPKALLGACLKLDAGSLDSHIAAQRGWSVAKTPAGEIVALPRAAPVPAAASIASDTIKLDDVAALIKTVAAHV